jgi:hypothetical protein
MTTPSSDEQKILPAVQPPEEEREPPSGKPERAEAEARTTVNTGNVDKQQNYGNVDTLNNFFSSGGAPSETPLEDLLEDLPGLPPNLHPFRDPRHGRLVSELENRRVLLLTSYQENAAYAAAFSLVHDDHFRRQGKKALFPTRSRDKERSDLDLAALAEERFLGETPKILLIEIDSKCNLLDSALNFGPGIFSKVHRRLENHSSYLILAVDEDLLRNEAETAKARSTLPYYAVSHLRYLLTQDFADRADDLERRLLAVIDRGTMELRELHKNVAARLAEGVAAFEGFLIKLEQAGSLPLAVRKEQWQPIQPQNVFREESEVHKAAAFVATYLPDLSQRDFDRLVLLLLGDETSTGERTRQVVGSDGGLTTLREPIEERWSDRWLRDADSVFGDCHLRAVISGDGSWVVDFSEPYLRRELRGYLERRFPWYVRRQCRALQNSGALFAIDLSRTTVEGLVRLFVERAIVDPAGFGSIWLLDLVQGLRIQLEGEPPSASPEEGLAWLLERLAVEAHLRAHFYGRLALLIREMLDHEALRPIVREFFEFLIAARQHDALLNVILDLARRLRFAPHFDPLVWLRRLLDQGSEAVRERTAKRLLTLARESGPRIYEFLAVLRSWLPEVGRPTERFSVSNRFALEFPFAYCLDMARSLPPERFGVWPSRHPLFYALPSNPKEAREEIAKLVNWLLDPRGVALEQADPTETMRTADVVRISHVADLVEHWVWVLEGGSEDGPAEGCALFRVVVEEIDRRIGARERTWLQRSWQRRQEDYLRQAANSGTSGGPGRALLIARRAKLDQLRTRFAALANQQGPASEETSETKRGTAP